MRTQTCDDNILHVDDDLSVHTLNRRRRYSRCFVGYSHLACRYIYHSLREFATRERMFDPPQQHCTSAESVNGRERER